MSAEIIRCEQRSEAWYRARLGLATASQFATIQMRGKKGAESVTRRKYLLTLAGEIITGEPAEEYDNPYMERGRNQEPEARDLYAFTCAVTPELVGFIRNGRAGCSPDALIGDTGMLELKTAKASILIDYLMDGKFPPEHVAQCQGNLWIAEREWIDLAIYSPGLPLFVKRIQRDDTYIADLSRSVDQFNEELDAVVEKVRRYGQPSAAILKEQFRESLVMAG
jgi:hypothetical protein